ncbi:hypothetical protein PAERUG_P54_1_London_24_VIM_2_04_13_02569 [Pseudomonas aeruginosa]|nr:hypothetical protein PAERUG_P54_1_London_24_VIM_2_04_13_02569 [Pseudomonas aeruginosa]
MSEVVLVEAAEFVVQRALEQQAGSRQSRVILDDQQAMHVAGAVSRLAGERAARRAAQAKHQARLANRSVQAQELAADRPDLRAVAVVEQLAQPVRTKGHDPRPQRQEEFASGLGHAEVEAPGKARSLRAEHPDLLAPQSLDRLQPGGHVGRQRAGGDQQ